MRYGAFQCTAARIMRQPMQDSDAKQGSLLQSFLHKMKDQRNLQFSFS